MIKTEELENLAALARLKLEPTEISELKKDLEGILKYVSELGSVNIEAGSTATETVNILRVDANYHQPGVYSEGLLAAAPAAKDNYVVVKKILDNA